MSPADLTAADFAAFPPEAHTTAVRHLVVLQSLPLLLAHRSFYASLPLWTGSCLPSAATVLAQLKTLTRRFLGETRSAPRRLSINRSRLGSGQPFAGGLAARSVRLHRAADRLAVEFAPDRALPSGRQCLCGGVCRCRSSACCHTAAWSRCPRGRGRWSRLALASAVSGHSGFTSHK